MRGVPNAVCPASTWFADSDHGQLTNGAQNIGKERAVFSTDVGLLRAWRRGWAHGAKVRKRRDGSRWGIPKFSFRLDGAERARASDGQAGRAVIGPIVVRYVTAFNNCYVVRHRSRAERSLPRMLRETARVIPRVKLHFCVETCACDKCPVWDAWKQKQHHTPRAERSSA